MVYYANPQHPDNYHEYPHKERVLGVLVTVQIEVPVQLDTEAIIEGERSRNPRLRDTCREFLGRTVDVLPPLPKEGHAICSECGEEKQLRYFSPDDRKTNGRHSECQACDAKRTAKRRALKRMAAFAASVQAEVK